jgi:predicted anti-sigma-YlaC factor YlaD
MDCDSIRAAISAGLDGEDPGVPGDVTQEHLAGCAACRAWQQRAPAITRRARLGGYVLDHDLAPGVLAALPAPGNRRPAWLRAGLLAAALAQLAITVPTLLLGHGHDAGLHAAHELGAFDLALAIAFAVGAVRPALSAGLAWPCGIAALGLAGTAVADLVAGQAFGADEAQHLVAIAGALLLLRQARLAGSRPAGHVHAIRGVPAGEAASPGDAPGKAAPGPGAARETRSWVPASGVHAG